MAKILISLMTVGTLVFAGPTAAAAFEKGTMARDAYKAEKDKIEAQYKADADRCRTLAGNARDICSAEAKGREKVAAAELDARDRNTDKARYDARVARAAADYAVAKERCDDLAGNPKNVCMKEAKAAQTRAKADAKVARVAREETNKANAKTNDERREAAKDTRDADYEVAREKCDTLAGGAKDRCVADAKARYGKT